MTATPARDPEPASAPPIVDWRRTGRRMRVVLLVIAFGVVAAWVVDGLTGDGFAVRRLAEFAGYGLFVAFGAEVVVIGGSAVRGLLAAGARGHRLASADVGLLPPQLQRRGQRRSRPPEG